jgi:hypothetical protein
MPTQLVFICGLAPLAAQRGEDTGTEQMGGLPVGRAMAGPSNLLVKCALVEALAHLAAQIASRKLDTIQTAIWLLGCVEMLLVASCCVVICQCSGIHVIVVPVVWVWVWEHGAVITAARPMPSLSFFFVKHVKHVK